MQFFISAKDKKLYFHTIISQNCIFSTESYLLIYRIVLYFYKVSYFYLILLNSIHFHRIFCFVFGNFVFFSQNNIFSLICILSQTGHFFIGSNLLFLVKKYGTEVDSHQIHINISFTAFFQHHTQNVFLISYQTWFSERPSKSTYNLCKGSQRYL